MRLLLAVFVAVLASASVAHGAGTLRATMTTSSVRPVAGTPWRYTITVRDGSNKPVAARVRLQVLVGPIVVGCWKGRVMTQCGASSAARWIRFRGKRTGILRWPAGSIGVKLVFRATVVAGEQTLYLRAPVRVRRAT
jgi:hypothetical protein